MPCSYYTDGEYLTIAKEQLRVTRNELDVVTRVACDLVKSIQKKDPDFKLPPNVAQWWVVHQEKDALRLAQEEAQRKEKAAAKKKTRAAAVARANALKKLTPEDRKALGLE